MSVELFGSKPKPLTSSNVLFALKSAYGRWRQALRNSTQLATGAEEQCFWKNLEYSIRFTGKSLKDANQACQLHASLSRGKELLSTALQWDNPVVGRGESATSKLRGLQWRSVIAWSGLEQIIQHLVASNTGGEDVSVLLTHLGLPNYRALFPPDKKLSSLRRWREKDDGDDGAGINGFLGASSKQTKKTLRSWLILGQPIQSWSEALMLAKVLRHTSAHGALSGSKIREWGLTPVFERLVPEMGAVAASLFDRMAVEVQTGLSGEVSTPVIQHNRALSLPQPSAEAVICGAKVFEIRSQPCSLRGRIYIYASHARIGKDKEAALMEQYRLEVQSQRLILGMLLGTVELFDCTKQEDCYHWHFRNPEKWKRAKLPEGKTHGAWFTPFKNGD